MRRLTCAFVVTNRRRQFFLSRSPIALERLESKMRNLIFVKYDITRTELLFAQALQCICSVYVESPRIILLETIFFIIQPDIR